MACIKMIGLFPQYQNKGIGTYALHQALGMLRSRGFTAAALYTNQSNRRAQSCYMKCGFKVTEKFVEKMANGKLAERYKMELTWQRKIKCVSYRERNLCTLFLRYGAVN